VLLDRHERSESPEPRAALFLSIVPSDEGRERRIAGMPRTFGVGQAGILHEDELPTDAG